MHRKHFLPLGILVLYVNGSAAPADACFPDPHNPVSILAIYDPATGDVHINGAGVTMTLLEIKSSQGLFISASVDPGFVQGPFDIATETTMFTLRTEGFSELALGSILPTGLTADALAADLTFSTYIPPGNCQSSEFEIHIVPEPWGCQLIALAFLAISNVPRSRRKPV